MAFFTKKTWVARQGTGLNKFSINGATPVTVVNQPDSVTEQGDALSATNLNNLEQRIYNAFLDVDGVFDNIEDGIVLVGRAKADQNGDIIDETYAKQNGYYAELGAGTAEQLVSTQTVDDDDAYLFRTSGGSADIGNRETDEIVGGTLGVNQKINFSVSYLKTININGSWNGNAYTFRGITYTIDETNKKITLQGNNTTNSWADLKLYPLGGKPRHVIILRGGISDNIQVQCSNFVNESFQDTGTGKIGLAYNNELAVVTLTVRPNTEVAESVVAIPQCVDLTEMFGSEIADYIYALEQATAGAGVAWFRHYFPKPYYPYNAGVLASVKPSSHDMTGFNQFDKDNVTENARWNGDEITSINGYCASPLIRVVPNTKYYFKDIVASNLMTGIMWMDGNKKFVSANTLAGSDGKASGEVTSPPNAMFVGVTTRTQDVGTCCVSLVWSGTRNGEYEPFELHSYPLDDSTEYRGMPKLDDEGNLYFDGDIYKSSGDVTRKWGYISDMSSLSWTQYSDHCCYARVYGAKEGAKCFCDKLVAINDGTGATDIALGFIGFYYNQDYIYAGISSPSDVNGYSLIYELATPTQETVNPFTNPQIVNDWGTEEYVDTRDMPIPVGHNTQYMANLRDKLQHLPNLANADGEYVVKQTGTQMELIKTDNLKKDGYYPTLAVGTADNLKGKGTVGADFTFRTSGGSADIGSGSARIDRINGNTLMMNQYAHRQSSESGTNAGVSYTYADGKFTLDGTASSNGAFVVDGFVACNIPSGHKLLLLCPSAHESMQYEYAFKNAGGSFISDRNLYTTEILTLSDTATQYYCSLRFYSGANFSNFKAYQPQLIDLTQMFGSGNEPTVDEFKALFPLGYYDYNTGTPLNFKGTGLKTVGFNQFNGHLVRGGIDYNTGANVANNQLRRSEYIRIFPNTYYYYKLVPNKLGLVHFYDSEMNHISVLEVTTSRLHQSSPKAMYMRFCSNLAVDAPLWDEAELCVNLSWSGIRNGEYEPYWDSTLDLPITTVKGKASGSDESVVIFPDGMRSAGVVRDLLTAKKGNVKVGVVDLGTLIWKKFTASGNYVNNFFYLDDSLLIPNCNANGGTTSAVTNASCSRYTPVKRNDIYYTQGTNGISIESFEGRGGVYICDSSKSSLTAEQFKTQMSGVYVFFELVTQTEYTLDEELNLNYRVDDFGTEQLLPENTSTPTTSPMIAEIAYAMNAVDTLRNLDKNFTNLATLDALIAIINSKCGVTITRGSFDSANNRYTFS